MKTTNGCTFYLYDYDDPAGTWQKKWPWTWSGACPGGVASGQGDLEAAMSSDSGHKYRSGYRGMLVGGRMNGRVEEITDGKMPADYYHQTFEMGCGSAEQFVYCKPYTGKVEAVKAAPPVTTGNLTAKQLAASDPAVVRADLNVSTEDRIFAVLTELATTGEVNLLMQANVILARRFPNSPFLPIAMQMVSALNNGDSWPPQKAAASTPAPAQAAPTANAGTSAAGAVTAEQVKTMLERDLGYAVKNIAGAGEAPLYEFSAQRDGRTIPVSFSVSANTKYVWAQVRLLSTAVPQPVSVAAMARAVEIQPSMFWTRSNGLWLGLARDNRGVTAADLRSMIDDVLQNTLATQDIWGQ